MAGRNGVMAWRQQTQWQCFTRRRFSHGGFTLIELIAVIVVMGILAAVAVPAMSSTTQTRAGLAAKQMLRDATFARQRAVATGTRTWIVFDPDNDAWSILAEDTDNPGRAGAAAVQDPATGRAFRQTLGVDEFIGVALLNVDLDDDAEVGFDWIGRPFNAQENPLAETGTATVTGGWTIHVEPETGHITLTP